MTTVSFWRAGSAASRLTPADVPDALLATADVVHLTGILAGLGPDSLACAQDTARRARAVGARVSFDVNHRTALWRGRDAGAAYRDLAAAADVLFAGEEEAAILVGAGTPGELAERLRALGPREVVIKRGAAGAFADDGCDRLDLPAVAVDAVDTVGAGDAFVAGYLSLRPEEAPLAERLRRAVAAGAFACLSSGDWEGAPTAAELARLGEEEGVLR